ncbi:MAG: hypothetical protein BGO41_12665 [Clostridiales bacterium 38-18]|mgnify:CR=1 FL=1|nr:MAG: hypothetical protein BGO41_12665 [Clostridiales bacterium 38-18]
MDPFERSYEVVRRVKKLKDSLHGNMSRLFKEGNLTGPQGMVVGLLFRMGPLKISELSQQMGLSMSTVSGILDRLERDNIVYREKSETDGRVILVKITEEFKKNSKHSFSNMNHRWDKILDLATDEEIDRILEALDILERLVEESRNL